MPPSSLRTYCWHIWGRDGGQKNTHKNKLETTIMNDSLAVASTWTKATLRFRATAKNISSTAHFGKGSGPAECMSSFGMAMILGRNSRARVACMACIDFHERSIITSAASDVLVVQSDRGRQEKNTHTYSRIPARSPR